MLLIGIAGGSGSGKTTLTKKLLELYPHGMISQLQMDSYYKDQGPLSRVEKALFNFDHPNSIDLELLLTHIQLLKNNIPIEKPSYSFLTCHRTKHKSKMKSTPIVILEGLFVLAEKQLRDQLTIKIFLNTSPETRLNRIVERDLGQRGRCKSVSESRFFTLVEPMYQQFVQPSEQYADYILNTEQSDINTEILQLSNILKNGLCEFSEKEVLQYHL